MDKVKRIAYIAGGIAVAVGVGFALGLVVAARMSAPRSMQKIA